MNILKKSILTVGILAAGLGFTSAAHAESDAWITTKAKLALWKAGDVRSTQVHVDTIDGTITLYGTVATAESKAKADKTVRAIKGVTQVRDLLQVVAKADMKAVAASDKDIKENVEKALKNDENLSEAKITVKSVNKGVVLLAGKAPTLIEHLIAIEDADEVAGVNRVATEVVAPDEIAMEEVLVVYTPRTTTTTTTTTKTVDKTKTTAKSSTMQDMRITSEVKMRLIGNADVPAMQINVDTVRSNVTLFGIVENEKAKTEAEGEAKKVEGVKMVKNQLQVVPPAKKEEVVANDDEIKKKTKDLLGKHAEYKDVNVEVKNGVVRLTGNVPSSWDRMHVATLTRATTGARAVHADMDVKK